MVDANFFLLMLQPSRVICFCDICLLAGLLACWLAGWLAQAVLVLCRGIFTPRNDVMESRSKHYVFAAAFEPEVGGYPLAGAFEEVSVFPLSCAPVPSPRPSHFA